MRISELLATGRQQLYANETAALDAEVLLAYVLKMQRAQLYAHAERIIQVEQIDCFKQLLARRLKGEPIAYLIGQQEFWSLPIQVTPDTLIPRTETECLVECVLAKLPPDEICSVADLGTGSGAIALALATERPHWNIIATDKMPAALAVAQQNATRLQLTNIHFKQGNWCEALVGNTFDAIVSNPPYINVDDHYWRENINAFEPVTALLAEKAGMADLENIIQQAKQYLKPQGWLLLEHGYDQRDSVQQLLLSYHYEWIESKEDIAHIPRVAVARTG